MDKKQKATRGSVARAIRWPIVLIAVALTMSVSLMPRAHAQGDDSVKSVDQLIDLLRDKYSVTAPGADLLFSHAFGVITAEVIEARHIGVGAIDGVECEHLAFATWKPIGRFGSRSAIDRSRANT